MSGIGACIPDTIVKAIPPRASSFYRPMMRIAAGSQPWSDSGIGMVEGREYGSAYDEAPFLRLSWAYLVQHLNPGLYQSLLWATIIVSIMVSTTSIIVRPCLMPAAASIFSVIWLGGALSLYAVASSAFGDGIIEPQKHAILLQTNILMALLGLFALIATALPRERFLRLAEKLSSRSSAAESRIIPDK
jgi:hypothetical protein